MFKQEGKNSLFSEKVGQMGIELTPVYMKEILNESPAQVNSREIISASYKASGSILLIFDRYGFCSLFCQV